MQEAGKAGHGHHSRDQGSRERGEERQRLDNSMISTKVFGGTAATTPATITITADSLALSNRAIIIARPTNGPAPAGNIVFNVEHTAGECEPGWDADRRTMSL